MTAQAYSAGTVFLQVLPVFQDVQNEIRREVEGIDRALATETEKSGKEAGRKAGKVFGEEFAKESTTGAAKAGDKAAEEYAGHFKTSMKKNLADLNRELKAQKLKLIDDDAVRQDFEKIRSEFVALSKMKIGVEIDADSVIAKGKAMMAQLDAIVANDSLDAEVRVNVDRAKSGLESFLGGAEKRLDRFRKEAEKMLVIEPEVDTKPAERQLGAFATRFKRTMQDAARSIGDGPGDELDQIRAQLKTLGDAEIGVDLSSDEAMAKARALMAQLERMDGQDLEIDAQVALLAAYAELAAFDKFISKIDGREIDIKADVDAGGAGAKLTALDKAMGNSDNSAQAAANSFRAFSGILLGAVLLGPALIPILAGIAGGLAAIAVIGTSVVAGLGVMILGFSGIGEAVSALGEVEKNAAKDKLAYAEAMRSATRTVVDAERNLARARQDAAQSEADAARTVARAREDAAQSIADAENSLSDTRQSSAESIADAENSLSDTRQNVAESIKSAEESLASAREDAAQSIADAEDSLTDTRKSSAESIADAEEALVQTRQDAAESITDAEEALAGARQDTAESISDAEKALVETRQDAVESIADAEESLRGTRQDAVQSIADAEESLVETRQNTAESIADAEESLVETRQDAAQSIADAEEALSEARTDAVDSVAEAEEDLARTRRDAAQANAEAARDVAEERRQSADLIERALEDEVDAQERLADAVESVADAEQSLREAREDAREEQADLADQRAQNLLDERQAQIDLFEAEVEYNAAMADGGATSLDREQAAIRLEQSRLNLKNIRDEQDELRKRDEAGVKGSEDVKDAQDALVRALEAQQEAQEALGRASADVDTARLEAARNINEALRDQRRVARDTNEAMRDALESLQETRASGAESVADALESLQEARTGGASAVADALETLQDARANGAEAIGEAIQSLQEARATGAEAISDALASLQDAQANGAEAISDASRAIQEARSDGAETMRNALDTLRDARTNGAGSIADALEDLQDARGNGAKAIAEALESVQRARASGADAIGGASKALHDARADGAETIREALETLRDARVNGADAVAAALENLSRSRVDGAQSVNDALRAQTRTGQQNERSLNDAQRNLTRAQRDYQGALKRTEEIGSASMQKLEQAMGKLSPAGRKFARFLFGLRDEFYGLRKVAQQGLLPGVQAGMEVLMKKYFPSFVNFVRRMARTVGNLFESAGKRFANDPVFQKFFGMLSDLGPRFMRQFGKMTLNWLSVFASLMTATAPFAKNFSDALLRLSKNASDWAKSAEGTEMWQDFLAYVNEVGPRVWEFFKNLFGAVLNIMEALAPIGELVMGALTSFLGFIANMDPDVLRPVVFTILALFTAFQLASGAIAIFGLASAVLSSTLILGVMVPLGLIVGGLTLLAGVFVLAYTQSETFRNIIKGSLEVIGKAWDYLWEKVIKPVLGLIGEMWEMLVKGMRTVWERDLKPILEDIGDGLTYLWEKAFRPLFKWIEWGWENILWPVFKAIVKAVWWLLIERLKLPFRLFGLAWDVLAKGIKWTFQNIIEPVFGAVGKAAEWLWGKVLKPVFGYIEKGWNLLVKAIKWYWNNVLEPVWGAIAKAAGWLWDKVLDVVFANIDNGWTLLVKAIKWYWNNVLEPVWGAIAKVAKWLWEKALKPIFTHIDDAWALLIKGIKWYWNNVLEPVWGAIAKAAGWLWEKALKPIFTKLGEFWDRLLRGMERIWENILRPVFDKIMDVAEDVGDVFEKVVEKIGNWWEKLENLAKKPIEFVIGTIINGGLIDGFNRIAKFFTGNEQTLGYIGGERNFKFAQGGVFPGYTPGRDVAYAAVSGGEAFMRPEWTRAVGEDEIDRMNKAARMGGVEGVRRYMSEGMGRFMGGYAGGGVVWPVPGRTTSTYAGHDGVDINRGSGWDDFRDPIVAARGGRVAYVGSEHGYGDAIFINTDTGYQNIYGHTDAQFVRAGDMVKTGQSIGLVGNTGNSSAPHLHFSVDPGMTYGSAMQFLRGALDFGGGAFDFSGAVNFDTPSFPGWILDAVRDPKGFLMDKIAGPLQNALLDNPLGKMLAEIPERLAGMAVDKIKDLGGDILSLAKGVLPDNPFSGEGGATAAKAAVVNIVQTDAADTYGWTGEQWNALNKLVMKESGFDPQAQNPNSSAYGLFQFLDSTWATVGGTKTDDPYEQTELGLRYIKDRYGNPVNALGFHNNFGWYSEGGVVPEGAEGATMYDGGGYLPPGLTTVLNLTGRPEPVFTGDQWDRIENRMSGSGNDIKIDLHGTDLKPGDVADELRFALRTVERGGVYAGGRV